MAPGNHISDHTDLLPNLKVKKMGWPFNVISGALSTAKTDIYNSGANASYVAQRSVSGEAQAITKYGSGVYTSLAHTSYEAQKTVGSISGDLTTASYDVQKSIANAGNWISQHIPKIPQLPNLGHYLMYIIIIIVIIAIIGVALFVM
ncbi:MAG: hypothetical protein ACYDC6_14235 [Acidobacteriaceae bacterium]